MTKKSGSKKTQPKAEAFTAPSALDFLRAAVSEKPTGVVVSQDLAMSMRDPAISGAVRKGKSSVVTLGPDPVILKEAAEAAKIKGELDDLSAKFKISQTKMRDYGAEKRKSYNRAFRADITTVAVPYQVEDETTGGKKVCHIKVVCSNKYTVAQESVIHGKDTLGEWYEKLFSTDTKKVLRPDAEDLFRKFLEELGFVDEALTKAMNVFLKEETTVSTRDDFEALEQTAPEHIQAFLSQSVTRVQPSLRFESEPGDGK